MTAARHPAPNATRPSLIAVVGALLLATAVGCDAEPAAHASEIEPPTEPAARPAQDEAQRPSPVRPAEPTSIPDAAGPPRFLEPPPAVPAAHFEPSFHRVDLPAVERASNADRADIIDLALDEDRIVALAAPGDRWLESKDGGVSWTRWRSEQAIGAVLPLPGRYGYGLGDMDPDGRTHRLARTEDDGRTWEWRVTGRKIEPEAFALIASDGRELALAVGPDVLVTRDRDRFRWQDAGLDDLTRITSLDYLADGTLAAGTDRGHVVVRRDDTWTVNTIPGLERHRINAVAAVPDGVLAASSAGLWRRTDADETWGRVDELGSADLRAIWTRDDVVVVVGAAGELGASVDAGRTFVRYTDQVRDTLGFAAPSDAITFEFHDIVETASGLVAAGNDWTLLEIRSGSLER